MSQYIRNIVVDEKNRKAIVKKDGKLVLTKDFVAEIVVLNGDVDDDTEDLTSIDFTSVRSRVTIHKGFKATYPLPHIVAKVLKLIGVKLDPAATIVLAALYEESGFNEYGREECDKMYLNTVLQSVKNGVVRAVIYDVLMTLIGNNYKWNNTSDQITVATMEPIWN